MSAYAKQKPRPIYGHTAFQNVDRQESNTRKRTTVHTLVLKGLGVCLPLGSFDAETFESACSKAYRQFRGSLARLDSMTWVISNERGSSMPLCRLQETPARLSLNPKNGSQK